MWFPSGVTLAEPRIPDVDLPRVDTPQFQIYDHNVAAFLVTDDAAIERWIDEFTSRPPTTIAADIETRDAERRFHITALTVAFQLGTDTVGLLFDPLRRSHHRKLIERVFDHTGVIVFHKSSFDVAPLYAHRLMTREHIRKVGDTLVAARMLRTNARGGRNLDELVTRYGIMGDDRIKITEVYRARGMTKDQGYWYTDIDCPTYVVGAMSDTVATLRLWGTPGVRGTGIVADAARHLTGAQYGLGGLGQLSPSDAEQVVEDMQQVNRILLERTARGYAVDAEFLERYERENSTGVKAAAEFLASNGIRPGNGADLLAVLVNAGEINPEDWPRTKGGGLSSESKVLEEAFEEDSPRNSPLVNAHRKVAQSAKILNYLTKSVEGSRFTGRLHPEIGVLGASATGRMNASDPPLQQFPKPARGIIVSDGGQWVSCDWKSIEPVVIATSAGDREFINVMRQGGDPYEPIGKICDIDRKEAKRKFLAEMYGQSARGAAAAFGWTVDFAMHVSQVLRQMLPIPYSLIDALKQLSEGQGHVTTLSGRVLDQHIRTPEGLIFKESVAPNHFCQGSALDLMHHSILEMDRRGLSDHIHLWMHDEIIADTSVHEELVGVMRTPPPFLEAIAHHHGFDPFLAVDSKVMESLRWEYC